MKRRRLAAIARALLAWFAGRERDVPWRGESDPYRIWVAEVMAQQTRIGTVREYWGRFLQRYPTVEALAGADPDELMKAWEGLGYYTRARNLRRAAREVVAHYGGRLPEDPAQLRSLPGIGPYTAAAVASLAFGRAEPAVDGNARRVLARLLDLASPTPRELESAARAILETHPDRAATLNQALMDLGGGICRPRGPRCPECPLRRLCLARRRGTTELRPAPRPRRRLPHRDVAVGLVWREGRLLIARRPPEGLLGGLWEFPGGKVERGETPPHAAQREIREELGMEVQIGEPVGRLEHAYSHFRITLHAFHARWRAGEPAPRTATAVAWVKPERLGEYAFPAANARIIELLGRHAAPGDARGEAGETAGSRPGRRGGRRG